MFLIHLRNKFLKKTKVIRFLLALLLFILLSKLYSMQLTGYPVTIDITTTSDWAKLDLENSKYCYLNDSLMSSEKNSVVNVRALSIEKKSYDSSLVCARFEICLLQELPPFIKFTITKGAIGETKAVVKFSDETLATFTATAMKNTFKINRDVIYKTPILSFELSLNNRKIQPLVLAFYFPWYKSNWFEEEKQLVTHDPLIGFYNSGNEQVLQKHVISAKSVGIDGFIVSWWGKNSFIDSNLYKIVPICEHLGLKFSIYLETANSFDELKHNIDYIETTYTRSSAFLRFENRPVLFIFSRLLEQVSLDSLILLTSNFALINYGYSYTNLKNFSGVHEFLPPGNDITTIRKNYLLASQITQRANKLLAMTVMPGYDARRIGNYKNYIGRNKGRFYRSMWDAVLESKPNWILITSFNEWFEGTEIEPSKEFGDLYLKLTKTYTNKFKQSNQ